ncbi:MAG: hypothetical protein LBJ19_01265 [Holosporaceae bacterium]|jgi:hypothetical protein|nr:hypothetical protein [Holosporaceae bacterium]
MISSCSVSPLYDECCSEPQATSAGVTVGVIGECDGQKLRSYLIDLFRDFPVKGNGYLLDVRLSRSEKSFAFEQDGYAKRRLFIYVADVNLLNSDRKLLMQRQIKVYVSYNISSGQWGIEVSLYGRHNNIMMRELAHRIVEAVKVFLSKKFSDDDSSFKKMKWNNSIKDEGNPRIQNSDAEKSSGSFCE